MLAAGVGGRCADDTTLPSDDIFRLHRMALLFPGVILTLFRISAGPLNRLLGAIDDQGLGFRPAEFGLSINTDQRPRDLFDPLDRPADGALVDVVKEAQELLGDIATIINQHDQEVILQTANVPRAAGFGLATLSLLPGARELLQQAVERGDADTGQADEARAGAQPGGGERTGHWAGTFTKKVLDESNRPVTCQARGRWLRSATERRERAHFRNGSNITRAIPATQEALKLGLVGQALDDEIRRRVAFGVDISISLEPLPDPNNRLTLSKTRRDSLGLACPDIYYELGPYVHKGYDAACDQLRHIGKLFNAVEFNITTKLNANNHLMGGTIMGSDPNDSVVDGNCRAHDRANLWLPGGGPMPSSSVVNSTLSMAALALKSADDIAGVLRKS
jgi:hypothetical protein